MVMLEGNATGLLGREICIGACFTLGGIWDQIWGVLAVSLGVVVAGAIVQAFTPGLAPLGTIAFLTMAAALGAGSGATFALVAQLAPANQVGAVTGIVGAAGGLGGFIPPLLMGAIYGHFQSYALGLALLGVVALAALLLDVLSVGRRPVPA